jgi:hypothetical protein
MATRKRQGGPFQFRVSDSLDVPLRGWLLRLRLQGGTPSLKDLAAGRQLNLVGPTGQERTVTILDHAVTGGRVTQERLERTRELDVVISQMDAHGAGDVVEIGWTASGPVSGPG